MNDCYLNFLVSFRALFSLDVGANLVNSKQTIGIILPDLSLLGYAVPVESFGIGLFVILFAYLIIEYNVQLLSHEKFKIAMNMLHTAHTPLILLRNQLEELKTGNLPEPLSQQVEEALGYAECIIYCNRNIATLNKVNKRIPPKTSTVNLELSTYVTSIVNQCRAHANSRQIRLTVGECSDCVSCRINENIMTAALQHLINKMILISESGCCISINVTHTMNSWQLQISNNEIAGQRAGKMFPFIPIIFPVYGYSDLWTVRKIIRLHGGKITGCRHGKAATFQIVIPTDCHCQNQSCPVLKHSSAKTKTQIDDSCESPKSDKQNTKARETSHILLVMADKLFSDYLKKTLSRYFQISVLDNPELLINTAISQNPDAIIIDDNVNGISGDTGGKLVIKKCIAWNSMLVSTDKAKVGRIVGGTANATYENCYAYDGMILKAGEATFTVSDETSPSGSSFQGVAKSANELKNTVINWDSSLWKEGGNGYPVFKWSK